MLEKLLKIIVKDGTVLVDPCPKIIRNENHEQIKESIKQEILKKKSQQFVVGEFDPGTGDITTFVENSESPDN